MATKKRKQPDLKRQQEKKFTHAIKDLMYLTAVGAVIGVIAILMFFSNWTYIYNSDISGAEVAVSGFNCLAAGLSGTYSSADAMFGDMAVPFYYYAKQPTQTLCLVTVIAFFFAVCTLISALVTVITKKHALNPAAAALALVSCIMLVVCFGVSLSMSSTEILSVYCSGNPACSIRSFAIVPAILYLGIAALHTVAFVKYRRAKQEFRAEHT